MSNLAQGSIVWATIPDSRGTNSKVRPVVVLTPSHQIDPNETVTVAGITTMIGEAPFAESVQLPSDPSGHPITKLTRACEVVCSWVYDIPFKDLQNERGRVPSDLLAEIIEKVEHYN